MYAIVETGGKQYRVQPGDTIAVERLAGEPGETLELDRVLLLGGSDTETRVGAPGVSGAVVRAEVVDHHRGEKIIIFRYKSKVRYRRKTGHRQQLTRLRITDILLNGRSLATAAASARPRAAEPAPPVTEPAQPEAAAVETSMPPAAAEAGPAPGHPSDAGASLGNPPESIESPPPPPASAPEEE